WRHLRNGQLDRYAFRRRQHPVGPYVLDFYCPMLRLAIELDGGQHGELSNILRDQRRTAWLTERGVRMLRFWNSDVTNNLSGVLETIRTIAADQRNAEMTPTRRWRADLPLSGGGETPRDRA